MTVCFDTAYIAVMSYLLIKTSSIFLFILLMLTFLKTLTGGLVYLTPIPEDYITNKQEIIESFWMKTAVDAIIGLSCYCLMLWGGIDYGQ